MVSGPPDGIKPLKLKSGKYMFFRRRSHMKIYLIWQQWFETSLAQLLQNFAPACWCGVNSGVTFLWSLVRLGDFLYDSGALTARGVLGSCLHWNKSVWQRRVTIRGRVRHIRINHWDAGRTLRADWLPACNTWKQWVNPRWPGLVIP